MSALGLPFREVYLIDTEFRVSGRDHPSLPDTPEPVCLVARELSSNRLIRLWRDELVGSSPPFSLAKDTLFVAYGAAAEWGVFLELGWQLPARVIDLFFEFLLETNDGRPRVKGSTGLLAAKKAHHVPGITSEQKEAERDLILSEGFGQRLRAGTNPPEEVQRVLEYCQTDVDPMGMLFERMLPAIRVYPEGLAHALIRGQYSTVLAHMERRGYPVDAWLSGLIWEHKAQVRTDLIAQYDHHNFYVDGVFKQGRFENFLYQNRCDWKLTETGQAELSDDFLKDMSGRYEWVNDFRQLRRSLSQLAGKPLFVGTDSRVRPFLNPFGTKTGRNNPSSTDFLPGRPPWMRGLFLPAPHRSLITLDWKSQEVYIAAVLSRDQRLLDDLQRGDVYLGLATAAGLAPAGATKQSHSEARELAKICFLAAGYGQRAEGMALRTGMAVRGAANVLASLRRLYPVFYEWAEYATNSGLYVMNQNTMLGWRCWWTEEEGANTVRNFPVQGNGAEMMRLACVNAVKTDVELVVPIHDALMIECDTVDYLDAVATARAAMNKASAALLGGVTIPVEAEKFMHWPNRLVPEKGRQMWSTVMASLSRQTGLSREELETKTAGRCGGCRGGGCRGGL